jgi:glucose/mannose-6-phosphate isomerase
MGGSAIGADLIKDYLRDEIKVTIYVNRDYTIPDFVGRDSLVFACSYSGNTEETLSAYSRAKKNGAKVIAVTSGGKLEKLARKNRDLVVSIPQGYPPRCALGYSFIPPLLLLGKLRLIKNKESDIDEMIALVEKIRKTSVGADIPDNKNLAKRIAKKVFSRFPVVYASDRLGVVVTRWKGQFAENAKSLSSGHMYSEMNHNEIVGWHNPKDLLRRFLIIQLRDGKDHPRIIKRMDITKKILKKQGFEVMEIESRGGGLLSRMLSLMYIGDFVSFYLAVLNHVDPTPVKRITYLKKELAKV